MSLFLTPRLRGGATLAEFPDWLDWTGRLQAGGVRVALRAGGQESVLHADPPGLRPALWASIFRADAPVDASQPADYPDRLILSYPVADAVAEIKNLYQRVGAHSGSALPSDELFTEGVRSFGLGRHRNDYNTDVRARQRLEAWREQQARRARGRPRRHPGAPVASRDVDGIPTRVGPTSATAVRATSQQFALAQMPPVVEPEPLPSTEADFTGRFGFHAALSALHSYPTLLRRLGLVIDLELPIGAIPLSPSAAGQPHAEIVVTEFALETSWEMAPTLKLPRTAYVRRDPTEGADDTPRPAVFAAAPTEPVAPGALPQTLCDVVDGFVPMPPDAFLLTQLDVDGAMHKLMALADNLDNARGDAGPGGLPALRSAGFVVVANARAAQLQAALEEGKRLADSLEGNHGAPRALVALDLLRGYRFDVWSSMTGRWESLHRRNGTYAVGGNPPESEVDEEGFVQPALTTAARDARAKPDPDLGDPTLPPSGTDLYLGEPLARWDGWSLSVPRPVRAISRGASQPEDAIADDPSAGEPRTPFKLVTSFTRVAGSLPALRFGARYRLRARAVDLGGNSVGHQTPVPEGAATPPLPYLRYEPVTAPALVLRSPTLDPGASLERLVIRSFNEDPSLDAVPVSDQAERHIAPPRAAEALCEQHGAFDDASGKLKGDAATYELIKSRDAGHFATVDSGDSAHTQVPLEPGPTLALPYMPDPLARGAAFRSLPGAPARALVRCGPAGSTLELKPESDAPPEPVVLVEFAGAWPELSAFRIALREGAAPPLWDAGARELRVFLPKAGMLTTQLSSFVNDDDLGLLAVWHWLVSYLEAEHAEATASVHAGTGQVLNEIALRRGRLTQLFREGGHWMVTPWRTLTLVHAVQQPIGHPQIVPVALQRPAFALVNPAGLLHDAEAPRSPLVAWRASGSSDAYLLGGLRLHAASTAKVDLMASWTDLLDDPGTARPMRAPTSAHVEEIPLPETTDAPLAAPGPERRPVGRYLAATDMVWFAQAGDRLHGLQNERLAAPRHQLPDTRHRVVRYRAVATSRFRDYFTDDLTRTFTRTSEEVAVHVPSSARPAAPSVLYALPTFGWERQLSTEVKTSVRRGNGVRVYLERPWFSSGEGELLGVTLFAGRQPPTDEEREALKAHVSQWGMDPIWATGALAAVPVASDFSGATETGHGLTLPSLPGHVVDVAGHEVRFDEQRSLWYCDITIDAFQTYAPFVRLVLARYQPRAIPGAELSPAVLADFVQLPADRSAVVTTDPSNPRRLRLVLAGLAPQGPVRSLVVVHVEGGRPDVASDLGWAPSAEAQVTADPGLPTPPDAVLWAGAIEVAGERPLSDFRIVVREYEQIARDAKSFLELIDAVRDREPLVGQRLVYADVIPLGPQAPGVYPMPPSFEGGVQPGGETSADTESMVQPFLGENPTPPWSPIGDPPLPAALDPAQLPTLVRVNNPQTVDGHVKLAQALLNAAGALPPSGNPLVVDGNFGSATQSATQSFQKNALLEVTGKIDPQTWIALFTHAPFAHLEPGPDEPPMQGPPVAMLQQVLNAAGAAPRLAMSGKFDEATQDALADFQTRHLLPASGGTDPLTWAAIANLLAELSPTGTIRLTFDYDVAAMPPVTFSTRESLEHVPPLSDSLEPLEAYSGFWIEWQDENGLPIFRSVMRSPIQLYMEVPSSDPFAEFDHVPLAHPKGSFQVVLPVLPRARTLAIFSSPLDRANMNAVATLLVAFNVADLV